MRNNYSFEIDNRLVSIDITVVECVQGIYINRIFVPRELRGNGYGSAGLRCLCIDADREGVTLLVEPAPYNRTSMLLERLERWYRKFGFSKRIDGIYARLPNSVDLPEIF